MDQKDTLVLVASCVCVALALVPALLFPKNKDT